jgi:hypothetical protein
MPSRVRPSTHTSCTSASGNRTARLARLSSRILSAIETLAPHDSLKMNRTRRACNHRAPRITTFQARNASTVVSCGAESVLPRLWSRWP